jgi:CheY-like chemotaxis protein
MQKNRIGYKKPMRILLAEDNKVNQVLTRGLLSCLGYPCDLVEDGEAAVAANESQPYDLILMDCQLPRLDGYKAASLIKSSREELPIIAAYSANVLPVQQALCHEAGMEFILAKPITLDSLSALLEQVYLRLHPENKPMRHIDSPL